jgi:hypothetical protein
MLVLVLLPMVIDYFNGYTCVCIFGIAAEIKIMEEPSLVFPCWWFGFIRLPLVIYKSQDCVIEEKDLRHQRFSQQFSETT